jgi:membrane protein
MPPKHMAATYTTESRHRQRDFAICVLPHLGQQSAVKKPNINSFSFRAITPRLARKHKCLAQGTQFAVQGKAAFQFVIWCRMWRLLRETFEEFSRDECPRLAAALAYYAVFSLPALLLVVVSIAGLFFEREEVVSRLNDFLGEVMGPRAAQAIGGMVGQANQSGQGKWNSLLGLAMLLFGATGVLSELQTALNRAWQVTPDPQQGGVRAFLLKRVVSLGMVLAIALLLLISMVVSWLLAEFSSLAEAQAPGWVPSQLTRLFDQIVSLAIITLLFAALFKYLPDVRLSWTDVWAGAVITALLFIAGKAGVSMYLAWSDPTTAFGAAGSLALVLVWIYYSGMIFFLGAEFTHVYARSRGRRIEPEEGAVEDHQRPNKSP